MKEYFIDITTDEEIDKRGRVITVMANNRHHALRLAYKKMEKDELVYQIRVKIAGCDLPQPVYDFMNGFSIYEYIKE